MSKPEISNYRGQKMLVLNPDDFYKFSFGLKKAQQIIDNYEAIKAFVSSQGETCEPNHQQALTVSDLFKVK